ncbi:MAG: DNA primase [Patescibacteria group bacterium]
MTPIDEIKNRLDIVEVVQDYVKLKKAGKDYKALCPFHKERNPSFFVSPSKQIWHCFSCNFGGDMFSFVMKIEGVEFADALRTLARKAGVVLKREDPQLKSQRNTLYAICEEATEFFQKQLEKNKSVLDYLKNRGLRPTTIQEFKVGYAPESWDALYKHLTELGFKGVDVEKAGFIVQKEQTQNFYDRFRNRIMFPIFDLSGQVVGFSGRIFGKEDEKKAKYVNTPDTLIYNKSKIIYGLDKAKMEIRKKNECIVVEGQMDLIMCHQAGSRNAIATSGSALTLDQLRVLKRYSDNLIFSFDADTGGEQATKRAISSAQQLEFNIKVALLPGPPAGGKDPAEIIKKDPKKWENILENSKPIMEFYFENAFSKYPNLTVENKREIAKELLYPIKNISNVVEQAHWLQVLASKLKVEERKLVEALQRIKARETGEEEILLTPEFRQESRIKNLEEHLLGLILKYSQYLDYVKKELNPNILTTLEIRDIFLKLKSFKEKFDLKKFQDELSSDEVYLTNYLIFKAEYCELEEKEVLNEIECCLKEIKVYNLKERMGQTSLDIKEAEELKNKEEVKKLKHKFSKLAEELNKLHQETSNK